MEESFIFLKSQTKLSLPVEELFIVLAFFDPTQRDGTVIHDNYYGIGSEPWLQIDEN
jgi:hypothetical protein